MTIPSKEKQQQILDYLYSFRFLHTNHFQKLYNHTNKTTVKEWLKYIKEKGYIAKVKNEKESFETRSKPQIYYLTPKARHLLMQDKKYDRAILQRIYREKKRGQKFINKCVTIADIYLSMYSRKQSNQELEFFTETELVTYEYFPKPLPSAYISVTTNDETQRYFLDLFEEDTPPFVVRNRLNIYLRYTKTGNWESETDNEPYPTLLFVCPSKQLKSHLYLYAKAKCKQLLIEKFDIYVTTREAIKSGRDNIWEKANNEVNDEEF